LKIKATQDDSDLQSGKTVQKISPRRQCGRRDLYLYFPSGGKETSGTKKSKNSRGADHEEGNDETTVPSAAN